MVMLPNSLRRLAKRLVRGQPPPPPLPLAQRQLVLGLGAMKCGTTWPSDYLGSHPQFFHSPIKEMNAFASLFPENPLYPSYIYKPGNAYRIWRMEKIVLSFGSKPPRLDRSDSEQERFDRLRALEREVAGDPLVHVDPSGRRQVVELLLEFATSLRRQQRLVVDVPRRGLALVEELEGVARHRP